VRSEKRPSDDPVFIVVGIPSSYAGTIDVHVTEGHLVVSTALALKGRLGLHTSEGGVIRHNASVGDSPATEQESSSINVTGTGVIVKLFFADEMAGKETTEDESLGYIPHCRRFVLRIVLFCRKVLLAFGAYRLTLSRSTSSDSPTTSPV